MCAIYNFRIYESGLHAPKELYASSGPHKRCYIKSNTRSRMNAIFVDDAHICVLVVVVEYPRTAAIATGIAIDSRVAFY